ncbi:MAG: hypothetical protein RL748_3445 [Pseudomonadota bacterium]|jgi:hypothetical protein
MNPDSSDQHALAQLQQRMQQCLISGLPDQAHNWIKPNARQLPAARLAIYQRSYYARLLNCLCEQFPALCHALGQPLFEDFARLYLQQCPSDSYTLYQLGRRFPAYLVASRPEQPEVWMDFMCDLAHFERLVFALFDAPGPEQSGRLARQDSPDADLQWQSGCALGEYRFDVAAYYHGVRQQRKPPLPAMVRTCVALVRKNYLTRTLPLTPVQYQFLQRLQQGMTVAAALRDLAACLSLDLAQLERNWHSAQGSRARWIEAGMFVLAAS